MLVLIKLMLIIIRGSMVDFFNHGRLQCSAFFFAVRVILVNNLNIYPWWRSSSAVGAREWRRPAPRRAPACRPPTACLALQHAHHTKTTVCSEFTDHLFNLRLRKFLDTPTLSIVFQRKH